MSEVTQILQMIREGFVGMDREEALATLGMLSPTPDRTWAYTHELGDGGNFGANVPCLSDCNKLATFSLLLRLLRQHNTVKSFNEPGT